MQVFMCFVRFGLRLITEQRCQTRHSQSSQKKVETYQIMS